jgi:hypothetical protein
LVRYVLPFATFGLELRNIAAHVDGHAAPVARQWGFCRGTSGIARAVSQWRAYTAVFALANL